MEVSENDLVKISKISPMRSRFISDIRQICDNRQNRSDFDDMGMICSSAATSSMSMWLRILVAAEPRGS